MASRTSEEKNKPNRVESDKHKPVQHRVAMVTWFFSVCFLR